MLQEPHSHGRFWAQWWLGKLWSSRERSARLPLPFFASAFLCGQEGSSFSVPLGVASALQQRWTWVPSIHSVLLGGDGISIQLQGVTQYLAQSPPVVFML